MELEEITFNNTKITRSNQCRFLGIILDENLNFNEHVDNILKSLIKIGTAFKLLKRHINDKDKLKLYNAYFHSKLRYGLETFGITSNKNIRKLQRQQNRTLKILFNKDIRTNTKELHKDLNLLMVKDLRDLCLLQVLHKNIYEKDTSTSSTIQIKQNKSLHLHNTRQANNLHIPNYKTKQGRNTISYVATQEWNKLPVEIQNNERPHSFKRAVKRYFINSYINH